MRIFHVTPSTNVPSIQADGFTEDRAHDFADRPLFGDVMFEGEAGPFSAVSVDVPDEELAEYEDTEFHEHHAVHREWIHVPGELLNKYKQTCHVHEDPG